MVNTQHDLESGVIELQRKIGLYSLLMKSQSLSLDNILFCLNLDNILSFLNQITWCA